MNWVALRERVAVELMDDFGSGPNRQLLRCLIDSIGDLFYIKNRNGVYQGCKAASERLSGMSEAEQIGKTDYDFF